MHLAPGWKGVQHVLAPATHFRGHPGTSAWSMDRSLCGSSTGAVECRRKEQRRMVKLELTSKPEQGAAGCISCYECTVSDMDMVASIQVKDAAARKRRDGFSGHEMGTFGLWPDFREAKVALKWLPLTCETVRLRSGHVTSFKGDEASAEKMGGKRGQSADSKPEAPSSPHEELKNFICGGFAGVVSRTAVAPLDLIKTHLITSHGLHGYHKCATDIFWEIWERDGWRGLFRGNGVNCIRVAPCKAIELCTFEIVKKILSRQGNPLHGIAAPVAGGAAGMAGTLATYPLELIRTRISLQPHKYTGALQSIMTIVREEGCAALYAGLTPSILGVFPYAATNYFVYDGLRSAYHRASGKTRVPTGWTLLFGAVAAAASSAVTYPLEVARRQMQLGSAALVGRDSTLEVVRQIYAEEGFLALYRGLGTTWLKLVPAAGISFVCYEAARRAWEIEEQRMIQCRRNK